MPSRRSMRRSAIALAAAMATGLLLPGKAAAQWAILYGKNGHAVHGLPAEAASTLADQAMRGTALHCVSFAPGCGWVVLFGTDGLFARNIPDEAFNMLREQLQQGTEHLSIIFAPGGGWVVLGGNTILARNIADEAFQKLVELRDQGNHPKSIAFTPDGGWVVLFNRNGYFARNIPDDAYKKLGELAGKKAELKQVVFPPGGGWAILHNRNSVAMKDLPHDTAKALNAVAAKSADLKWLAFTPSSMIELSHDDQKTRDEVLKRMARHHVPGLGIAVIDKHKVEWARGYGVLRAGEQQPVTERTRFQAASISKPVSAVAALRLVQQKKLDLDEDLNAKLVSWKVPDNEFTRQKHPTLRQALSHSAGFNVHGFGGYLPAAPVPTLVQLLDGQPPSNSPPIRVEFLPGSKSQYSGGGYCVIQQLLVDVARKPFGEILQEQVLHPAGMRHSTFGLLPRDWEPEASIAHDSEGRPLEQRWNVYEPTLAAAGLWTTPEDLAHFSLALIAAQRGGGKELLAPPEIKALLTRQIGDAGLGLFISGNGRSLSFTHSGANAGYRCLLIGFPATGQGAVLMTNSDDGDKLCGELIESLRVEYDWPG